jgi:sulfur-oxidizing protein SoxY
LNKHLAEHDSEQPAAPRAERLTGRPILRRARRLATTLLVAAAALAGTPAAIAQPVVDPGAADPADPYKSLPWVDMRREYLGASARTVFDERVKVVGPGFAEDPMNVPISVSAPELEGVERIVVMVDRNPIRKVLELQPVGALPSVSFRFKLEQASPVRAAVLTSDGLWHIGSTWVDSSGGGCTVSGATRKDGSWSQTLGAVSGRMFDATPMPGALDSGARLRLRIMHPMDTGLVNGIPAFHLTRFAVRDGHGAELLRIQTFEPVSENPVFSFDFTVRPPSPLRISGVDNNGNRIESRVE